MNPLIIMPKSLLPLIIVHGCAAVFFWGWVIGECFIPRGERRDASRRGTDCTSVDGNVD